MPETSALDLYKGLFGVPSGDALQVSGAVLGSLMSIPYENVSKILSPGLLRTPEVVMSGFASRGLGGTCFSLTWLLRTVLSGLGVESRLCMADRSYGENTHCALVLEFSGGLFLLDPGYLIFRPVRIQESGSSVFSFGAGVFNMDVSEGAASVYSVVGGGDLKFRYRLRLGGVSEFVFFDCWKRSFSFAMMGCPVVSKYVDGRLVYLRGTRLQDGAGPARMLSPEGAASYLDSVGVSGADYLAALGASKGNVLCTRGS